MCCCSAQRARVPSGNLQLIYPPQLHQEPVQNSLLPTIFALTNSTVTHQEKVIILFIVITNEVKILLPLVSEHTYHFMNEIKTRLLFPNSNK